MPCYTSAPPQDGGSSSSFSHFSILETDLPQFLFPSEDALQIAAADFLRLACPMGGSVIWFHCPNGGKRAMATAIKLKAMGLLAGVPDLIFIWHDRGVHLRIAFIELKRKPIHHLKGAQKIFQHWCDRLRIPHKVCWTLDDIQASLKGWGVPLKASL